MRKIKGHLRCSTVEEVKERITKESLRELYAIVEKEKEQRENIVVIDGVRRAMVDGMPMCNWIDKYCINPHQINKDWVSFLVHGKNVWEVFYEFDNEFNIIDVHIIILA